MAWVTPRPEGGGSRIAHANRLVLRVSRGKLVAQAWPKKRGNQQTDFQRQTVKNFVDAQFLAKHGDPGQWLVAMEATKKTGLYPRDLLTRAITVGIQDVIFEDGTELNRCQPKYEIPMFQGCRVHRTSSVSLTSGAARTITWQASLLNPLGMWDVGDPTRITIPPGANVASFFFQCAPSTNENADVSYIIRNESTSTTYGFAVFGRTSLTYGLGALCSTGPVPVVAGQNWIAQINPGVTRSFQGSQSAMWFSCELGFVP